MRMFFAVAALVVVTLQGCGRESAPQGAPPPVDVTAEATGRYCGMLLRDHDGPKGQVYLRDTKQPVWFSSARDTLAFMRLPEEPRDFVAIYVSDMARSQHWEQPDPGAWVDPRQAWFVIDSDRRGGMGAPEAVPFSNPAAAQAFQAAHKGRVVRLTEIPDAYILGPVDVSGSGASATQGGHAHPGASR